MKQKKRPVLDITGFFLCMSSQVKAVTWVRMWKKKPVISNFFCFNNNVSNLYNNNVSNLYNNNVSNLYNNNVSDLYNNRVVEKTNGMAFNPTVTWNEKCIHWLIYHQSIVHLKKNVKYYYPYVSINPIYLINYYSKI